MAGPGADFPRVSPPFFKIGDAQVFNVELRPGETTIVSWKKLLRDANKAAGPISSDPEPPLTAHSNLDSWIAPGQATENEVKDALGPHRFSAVVEKIERLYMGKHSSDEEDLNDYHDDDQYDTEDSFIDDAELDEYFEVDNSEIKHDGFFVNRGKLEHTEHTISPNQQMRKRRKKDLPKVLKENGDAHVSNKHSKLNKESSGKAVLQKTNAYKPSQSLVSNNDQLNASRVHSKKKSTEAGITLDNSYPITVSNNYTSASHSESKKIEKQKMRVLQPKKFSNKWKHANDPSEISHHKSHFPTPLPDDSIPMYPLQTTKTLHAKMQKKDGSSIKPKNNMLERAIRELERIVAESRPPLVENQETDSSSQIFKRRLPKEIKLKLARVARSAQTSHGKLSKDIINRLMGILGNMMNLRTLKRNLKAMISMGLPVKQEKEDRFQQTKMELTEMIKMRIATFKSKASDKQAGKSDGLEVCSEGKGTSERKLSLGTALEDKICDLYDIFVDGLGEDVGPQIRKLYVELAELWPNGMMDSHSIRRAICRAKERQKSQHNSHKDQEKMKKKKTLATEAEEAKRVESSSTIQPQEKLSATCNAHVTVSASDSTKKKVKTKPGGVEVTSDNSSAAIVSETDPTKKKMKRKPASS